MTGALDECTIKLLLHFIRKFLYRCSRLSARIKNSLDHHTVFHELKLVTTSKPCGVCPEFDRRTGSRPSHFSAENLNREIPELYVHPKVDAIEIISDKKISLENYFRPSETLTSEQ